MPFRGSAPSASGSPVHATTNGRTSSSSAQASAASRPPRRWAARPLTITLLDRQNYHCFQPLLVPGGDRGACRRPRSPGRSAIFCGASKTRQSSWRKSTASTPPHASSRPRPVECRSTFWWSRPARGHSYFGHDEWIAFAPGLKRIEDATRIRRNLLSAFEQAELAARRSAAAALTHVRGRRRRPHRRRDGRRHRRNRPADAGPRFPANRSAYGRASC